MRNKLILVFVTALVTLVGQFELQQLLQKKLKPVLVTSVLRTDLSGLPPAILQQLPLIPLNYTIKHNYGNEADNVTILIHGDTALNIANIKFSPDSEPCQTTMPDPSVIRINVPIIRPGGLLNFQIIAPASSKIFFSELSSNAKIINAKKLEDENQKSTTRIQMCIIGLGVIVWLGLVIAVGFALWQMGKWWEKIDNGDAPPEFKHHLIVSIVVLFIYNIVVNSFGPLGGLLPIPRISFDDFTGTFILYLLVTRYKLVEAWLVSKTTKSEPPKSGN
jgi:hypothetical protein